MTKVILVLEVDLESPVEFLADKAAGRIRVIQGVFNVTVISEGIKHYEISERINQRNPIKPIA